MKGPLEARIKPRSIEGIPPKNIIWGRVVDSVGNPVDKAVVSVEMVQQGNTGRGSPPPGTDPLAVSDESGQFAIYSRENFDSMQLKVEARAMAPRRFNDVRGGTLPKEFKVTEGAVLRGRVTLRGQPIPDFRVGAVSVNRNDYFSGDFQYATREDGTFVFPNLPPDREYYVYGMMSSFGETGVVPARLVNMRSDGTVTDAGELPIQPGHRLAGKVVLSDHKLLPPNTRLTVGRREAWDVLAVDLPPSGEFSIPQLPDESLTMGARVEGYRHSAQNASLDRLNPFGLAGRLKGDKTNLVILLEPGEQLPSVWDAAPADERPENLPLRGIEEGAQREVWVVSGVVIDAETRQPIDGARITSARARGGQARFLEWEVTRSATTSNGVYRLELPPSRDPRLLRVLAPHYLPGKSDLIRYEAGVASLVGGSILARPGESTVNFELKQGEGPSGVLLSVAGEPLEAAVVYYLVAGEQGGLNNDGALSAYNAGDDCKQATSADGAFRFIARLGSGELFAATKNGFARASVADFPSGAPLRLQSWSRIRGVLLRDGQPLAGENVDLQWPQGFTQDAPYINLHGAVTDDAGVFEITHVPPGRMGLALRDKRGGGGGWTSISIKSFEVSPGEELDLGSIPAPRNR